VFRDTINLNIFMMNGIEVGTMGGILRENNFVGIVLTSSFLIVCMKVFSRLRLLLNSQ
jgi:hypothetical protein